MPLCLRGGLTSSSPLNRHHEANMPLPVIIALPADQARVGLRPGIQPALRTGKLRLAGFLYPYPRCPSPSTRHARSAKRWQGRGVAPGSAGSLGTPCTPWRCALQGVRRWACGPTPGAGTRRQGGAGVRTRSVEKTRVKSGFVFPIPGSDARLDPASVMPLSSPWAGKTTNPSVVRRPVIVRSPTRRSTTLPAFSSVLKSR